MSPISFFGEARPISFLSLSAGRQGIASSPFSLVVCCLHFFLSFSVACLHFQYVLPQLLLLGLLVSCLHFHYETCLCTASTFIFSSLSLYVLPHLSFSAFCHTTASILIITCMLVSVGTVNFNLSSGQDLSLLLHFILLRSIMSCMSYTFIPIQLAMHIHQESEFSQTAPTKTLQLLTSILFL